MAFQDYLQEVKTQLAAEGIELTNAKTRAVVDVVFGVVASTGEVRIPAFGSFKTKIRAAKAARIGRNPSTGEPLEIPAQPEKSYLAFKQAKNA